MCILTFKICAIKLYIIIKHHIKGAHTHTHTTNMTITASYFLTYNVQYIMNFVTYNLERIITEKGNTTLMKGQLKLLIMLMIIIAFKKFSTFIYEVLNTFILQIATTII